MSTPGAVVRELTATVGAPQVGGVPIHFGSAERRLFGLFHPAKSRLERSTAVLFSNPFGQEAIRLHRLFRVVAERLALRGIASLRFDYFGTGDSYGEDEEFELEGCQCDIRLAHRELLGMSGASQCVWFGAGIGASSMLLGDDLDPAERVVLWNPIVNGAAYLNELRGEHVAALEASFSLVDPSWRQALRHNDAFTREASGFGISLRFRSQLAALRIAPDIRPAQLLHVVTTSDNQLVRDWVRSRRDAGIPTGLTLLSETFEWGAEQLRGTALAPPKTVASIVSLLSE